MTKYAAIKAAQQRFAEKMNNIVGNGAGWRKDGSECHPKGSGLP